MPILLVFLFIASAVSIAVWYGITHPPNNSPQPDPPQPSTVVLKPDSSDMVYGPYTVAMSLDGSVIAFTGSTNKNAQGETFVGASKYAVWIYSRTGHNTWSDPPAKIVASSAQESYPCLALDDTGITLAIGYNDGTPNYVGRVLIYGKSSGNQWSQVVTIDPNVTSGLTGFASSAGCLAFAQHGSRLFVGAPQYGTTTSFPPTYGSGGVFIVDKINNVWQSATGPVRANLVNGREGTWIAVSEDGLKYISGIPYAFGGNGAVVYYSYSSNQWNGNILVPEDLPNGTNFGAVVSGNSDLTHFAVLAPTGGLWIYDGPLTSFANSQITLIREHPEYPITNVCMNGNATSILNAIIPPESDFTTPVLELLYNGESVATPPIEHMPPSELGTDTVRDYGVSLAMDRAGEYKVILFDWMNVENTTTSGGVVVEFTPGGTY